MKRLLYAAMFLVCFGGAAFSADVVYNERLANGGVAVSNNYDLDLSKNKVDILSFQAIYTTDTFNVTGFTDGRRSTGTITVVTNTALTGAVLTIANRTYTQGIDWQVGAASSNTALNIFNAIRKTDYSGLGNIINFSTNAVNSTVIFATAAVSGIDYVMTSSTPTALQVTGISSSTITNINYLYSTIDSTQSYPVGAGLLLTTVTGTPPTGLTATVTYYAMPYDSGHIRLSLSSTGAVAGLFIKLTQGGVDKGVFNLTPKNLIGTGYIVWQVSNDGINYNNANISSATITGNGSSMWDFGYANFEYIRAKFTAATLSTYNLIINGYGKKIQ